MQLHIAYSEHFGVLVRPPTKISSVVKSICKTIAPNISFLGAVYNHVQSRSDYVLYWLRSCRILTGNRSEVIK